MSLPIWWGLGIHPDHPSSYQVWSAGQHLHTSARSVHMIHTTENTYVCILHTPNMVKISQMYIQITVYMNVCMHVHVPVCTCTTTVHACMPINFMYMYIRMYIIQMCGPGITAYKKKHPSLVSVWFLRTGHTACVCVD